MLHRDFACEVQKTADSCTLNFHSCDDKNGTGSCVDVSMKNRTSVTTVSSLCSLFAVFAV